MIGNPRFSILIDATIKSSFNIIQPSLLSKWKCSHYICLWRKAAKDLIPSPYFIYLHSNQRKEPLGGPRGVHLQCRQTPLLFTRTFVLKSRSNILNSVPGAVYSVHSSLSLLSFAGRGAAKQYLSADNSIQFQHSGMPTRSRTGFH